MRWDVLAVRLRDAFTVERLQGPDGRVLTPAGGVPVDVQRLLAELLREEAGKERPEAEEDWESDELEELFEELASPEGAARALELIEEGWDTESLLSFWWDAFGPMSSSAGLLALDVGDGRRYVLAHIEEQPLYAVAAIEPGTASGTYEPFILSLLSDNGNSYGIDLFGSLPSGIENHRPDLIPWRIILESCREWMDWAAENIGPEVWADLRDSLVNELLEPDNLQRSLRMLKQMAPFLRNPEALRGWLQEREQEGEDLSEDDKSLIFELYFTGSYVERPKRKRRRVPASED